MKSFIFFALVAVLQGCSSYKPFVTQETKNQIKSLHVVSVIPQNKINVLTNQSAGGAIAGAQLGPLGAVIGGAIDSAIESSRSKKQLTYETKLNSLVSDLDITQLLHKTIKTSATNTNWANIADFKTSAPLRRKKLNEIILSMDSDALLVIESDYSLTPGLKLFEISAKAALYTKKPSKVEDGQQYKKHGETYVRYQSDLAYPSKKELQSQIDMITEEYKRRLDNAGSKIKKDAEKKWYRKQLYDTRVNFSKKLKKDIIRTIEANIASLQDSTSKNNELQNQEIAFLERQKKSYKKYSSYMEWTKNNGELLRENIDTGTQEVGRLLIHALNNTDITQITEGKEVTLTHSNLVDLNTSFEIKAVHIDRNEKLERNHYLVKRTALDTGIADYYSLADGEPIYPKLGR